MLAEPKQKQQQYKYNKSDEADQKIAVGLATAQILTEEGAQVVAKALSSGNPPKILAAFLAQLIEMIQTHSASTDIPMSPVVWLAEGGAVDELGEIFEVVAEKAGVEFDEEAIMPAVKQELARILQQRGQQLRQQADGAQQGPSPQDSVQAPQQGIAAPMGGMQ